jgi:hypothetical protein
VPLALLRAERTVPRHYLSDVTVTNSILWINVAPATPEIGLDSAMPTVTYSDVAGGWMGVGNFDLDPLLLDTLPVPRQGKFGDFWLSPAVLGTPPVPVFDITLFFPASGTTGSRPVPGPWTASPAARGPALSARGLRPEPGRRPVCGPGCRTIGSTPPRFRRRTRGTNRAQRDHHRRRRA